MARGVRGVSAAEVARALAGIDFPAREAQLIEHARRNGAEKEYQSMSDVLEAYGEIR